MTNIHRLALLSQLAGHVLGSGSVVCLACWKGRRKKRKASHPCCCVWPLEQGGGSCTQSASASFHATKHHHLPIGAWGLPDFFFAGGMSGCVVVLPGGRMPWANFACRAPFPPFLATSNGRLDPPGERQGVGKSQGGRWHLHPNFFRASGTCHWGKLDFTCLILLVLLVWGSGASLQ